MPSFSLRRVAKTAAIELAEFASMAWRPRTSFALTSGRDWSSRRTRGSGT